MTDKTCPTVLKLFVRKGRERGQLGMDRLFDQLARTIAENVREWSDEKPDGSSNW
ncbi:hypothetical protein GZH79_13140 [Loktanella sp. SALINAS62]|nr:hypothetical protein [Loktanella sp. SALINAS62]